MLYFLLPAYNEERDIAALLDRIRSAGSELGWAYRVLVVNDGSQDHTVEVVRQFAECMPIELIDHDVNRGLGQAMLTGLTRAVELAGERDVVVSMDADNTHDPLLAEAMMEAITTGSDLVIASRYAPGGQEVGLSEMRSLFSRCASLLLKTFFPIQGARDYTCGFRAYRGSLLRRAWAVYGSRLVEERGFTCMAEILIKMRLLTARISEVPLVLRYDLKSGQSKMKVMRTILRYFTLIRHNLGKQPVLDGVKI